MIAGPMLEMHMQCVFCKRVVSSCLDINKPTECTEFVSPFEDIKECFAIPYMHVSGDEGICSECFILIRFINAMRTHMRSAMNNEKCTVITIFNKFRSCLCSIKFQTNEHLEEMYATVCTEIQPDQYKESNRATTPSSNEVYGILKQKRTKRKKSISGMGRSSVNNVRMSSRASSVTSVRSVKSRGLRSEPIYDPNRCNIESRVGFGDDDDDDDDDDTDQSSREGDIKLNWLYCCRECREYFSTKKKLYDHNTRLHSYCMYCPICETQEKNVVEMQQHLDHHRIMSIPCEYCDRSFINFDRLKEHRKLAHRNKQKVVTPRMRMSVIFKGSIQFEGGGSFDDDDDPDRPFLKTVYTNSIGYDRFNHHDIYCLCVTNERVEFYYKDNIKMHDTYCSCKSRSSRSVHSDDEFPVDSPVIYRARESDSSDAELPISDYNVPNTSSRLSPQLSESETAIAPPSDSETAFAIAPEPENVLPSEQENAVLPKPEILALPESEIVVQLEQEDVVSQDPENMVLPERENMVPPERENTVLPEQEETLPPEPPKTLAPECSDKKNNGATIALDRASIYKQFIHDDSDKLNGCSVPVVSEDNSESKAAEQQIQTPVIAVEEPTPSTSAQFPEEQEEQVKVKPKKRKKKKSPAPLEDTQSSTNVIEYQETPSEEPLEEVKVVSNGGGEFNGGDGSTSENDKALDSKGTKNADEEYVVESHGGIHYEDIGSVEEIIEEVIEVNWQDKWQPDWDGDNQLPTKGGSAKKRNFFETFIKSDQPASTSNSVYDTFICRKNAKNKRGKVVEKDKVTSVLDEVYVINPNELYNSPNASQESTSKVKKKEDAVPSTTPVESLPGTSQRSKRSSNRENLLKLMDDFQKKQKQRVEVQEVTSSTSANTSEAEAEAASSTESSTVIERKNNSNISEMIEKVKSRISSPTRKNKRKPETTTKRLGMSSVTVKTVTNSDLKHIDGELYTKSAYKHAKKKAKR